ncbi:MAG: quinol dehydrogenase ferredoxin subunit NapH [Bdellovibrio bacteriovorus]
MSRLWSWRYLILRRVVQIGVLLLFFGTLHWGWVLFGQPLLSGNLSASMVLGQIPLADPFATLQILLTGHLPQPEALLGAAIVFAFFLVVGGRVWCAWVCPVNLVTDLAGWLHQKIWRKNLFSVPRSLRYIVLGMALLLSLVIGLPAFEWVSPIGAMHREILYGMGLGWTALLGLLLFDWLVLKHGWCGHLCPLGAFYSLLGSRTAQLRVKFDRETCNSCGDCAVVCPEPQVLNLKRLAEEGQVLSGECTNCGRCIPICPKESLAFGWRLQAGPLVPLPLKENLR